MEQTEANRLIDMVNLECPALRRMERQLTIEQARLLINEFGYSSVENQLRRMDNWKGIEKKNLSVYHTCVKWFEEDIRRGFFKTASQETETFRTIENGKIFGKIKKPSEGEVQDKRFRHVLTTDEVERRKQVFLTIYPIGSEFEFNGLQYIVRNSRLVEELESGKMIIIDEIVSK